MPEADGADVTYFIGFVGGLGAALIVFGFLAWLFVRSLSERAK